jgi:hypothetical protein
MPGGSDEVIIREVEDARGAQRVRKLPSARWVAGLTPEEVPMQAVPLPTASFDGFPRSTWLQTCVWWLTVNAAHANLPGDINVSEVVFPLTEVGSLQALESVSTAAIIAMFVVHAAVAIGGSYLALTLGKKTRSFANFVAFGLGPCIVVAAAGEMILLMGACTWLRRTDDCFLPFVLHWIVSVFIRFGPTLAMTLNMWGIASVRDVCKHIGLPGVVLVAISSLPLLYLAAGFASAWWNSSQEALSEAAPSAFWLTSVTTLFGAWVVNRIPPFKAIEAPKKKQHAE